MGAGASGQAPVVLPQQPIALPHGNMASQPHHDVGNVRHQREDYWMSSEPSRRQHATCPDVETSPTSTEVARRRHEAPSAGQESVNIGGVMSQPRRSVSRQQKQDYCGRQDTDTEAEVIPDLRVNLPLEAHSAYAVCDTSKDDILTKILTAEEYLGQLDEGDNRIKTLSAAEEKELHLPRIKELLAIRGHLQDELLRIHDMIVEDDADLSDLEGFVATNARIVQKLWDLNKNAREIADKIPKSEGSSIYTDLGTTSVMAGTQAALSKDSATGTDTSPQWQDAVSCGAAADTSDLGVGGEVHIVEELTESDLKKKHDEEEATVVSRYAHEIVKLEPQNEDIDDILHAHLLSMQALRDKQTREKELIRHSLAKKRQRLLSRSEFSQAKPVEGQGHNANSTNGNQPLSRVVIFEGERMSQTKMADQYAERQGHNGYDRGHDTILVAEKLYPQIHVNRGEQSGHDNLESGKDDIFKSSVEDMKVILQNGMNEGKEQGSGGKRGGIDHTGEQVWMNGDSSPDDDDTAPVDSDDSKPSNKQDGGQIHDWAKESFGQGCGMDNNDMEIEDVDGCEDEDNYVHEEDNHEHLDDLPRKPIRVSTAETGSGSDEVVKTRDKSFANRLARERLSDDDFADLLSKHLSDTECLRRQQIAEKQRLNDKMKTKLKEHENSNVQENVEPEDNAVVTDEILQLERRLQRKLLRKRDKLDETDIRDLFSKFRNKQKTILKLKEAEKEQRNQKLKEKLEGIRRQKTEKKLEIETENKEKEVEEMEKRIKKHRRVARNVDNSEVRESATSLVHKHQEDTRHINDLRKREREQMDERLKSRLNKKRL